MTIQFPPDLEPNELEKTNQFQRILTNRLFTKSPKLSQLLQFLVQSEQSGIAVDHDMVGMKVYGRSEGWIYLDDACVRDGMHRLRKLLEQYYVGDGMDDRLHLEFPQFKPLFSYNLRHPVERNLRWALRHLSTNPALAFSHLDEVLSIDPDHAEAIAARAETELWRTMAGNEVGLPDVLKAAELQMQQSLRADRNCWRAHVVAGALHFCHYRWTEANGAFESALACAPEQTRAHPWYAAFLMAVGNVDEALSLTKARASEPSDTPGPLFTYAAMLYVTRQAHEADKVLLRARTEYEDSWPSHVLLSCVFALQGDRVNVPLLGMSMQQSLPDGTAIYTGLLILEHLRRLYPDHRDYPKANRTFQKWIRAKLKAWEQPPKKRALWAFEGPRVSPFHLAIALMAVRENTKAVEFLALDVERGHPLMVWLHLWPIFDPLRDMPEFKSLVRTMNLSTISPSDS